MEIISADSVQVYRGMDIGTAKPDAQTRRCIPHHLLDIRDPSEAYSVADFCHDLVPLAGEITRRGRLPVIVGGAMLYLKALREGLAELPPRDPGIRAGLLREAQTCGWAALHKQLQAVDPVAAARIKPRDPQRLQRALEVYRITGTPLTVLQQKAAAAAPLDLIEIGIVPPDRGQLHKKIETRFMAMLGQGLVEEVRTLYERGDLDAGLPAIRSVGYRQVWAYLEGDLGFDAMVEKGVVATRRLAKRQYTWLRSWQDLQVLASPDIKEVLKIMRAASILT